MLIKHKVAYFNFNMKIIQKLCYSKTEHRLLAEALLEYETLNKQEVERVIKGEKLKKLVTTIKTPTTTGGVKKRAPPAVTFIPDRRTTSVD
jgi:ATP-dependent metalloprotease